MKKFHLAKNYAIINFDAATCTAKSEVFKFQKFQFSFKNIC